LNDDSQNGRKTVAFISCAPHQTRLFAFLQKGLPAQVRSKITNVNVLPLTPRYWIATLASLFAAPPAATDSIIALDLLKYLAHRPAASRGLDDLIKAIWVRVAAINYRYFQRRFAREKPDLLVVWGGFQLPIAAALAAARDAGVATLFCENGYLPKTIVMDPKGINAGNSLLGKSAEFYRAIAIPDEQRTGLLGTPLVTRPLKGGGTANETVALPELFVFLPLQVHDDSQILLYSPHFRDMPSVIRFCARGVDAYNRRHGTHLKLVVKEHPSDHGRIDYTGIRSEFPGAVFTKLTPTQELIQKCAAVVTVNSTVGIEALLQLKPVITLGDAFYAVPGLVRASNDEGDLAETLRDAFETPIDRDLTEHFLYFLRYAYLVPLDRNNLAGSDPKPAVAKILKALG
jgi:capsular polysaccharide export protein